MLDFWASSQFSTTVSLFTYEIDDLIEFVADPAPAITTRAQNAGRQRGYGLEWETRWKPVERVEVKTDIVWQNIEDKESGVDIADAPQQQIGVSANWKFLPGWSISARASWIAERARVAGDTRDPVDDYTLIDMTLRHLHPGEEWEVAALVKNLLDEEAFEPSSGSIPGDYPLPGRSAFLEFSYYFK